MRLPFLRARSPAVPQAPRRRDDGPADPAAAEDAVTAARTHARRRLLGALVLLMAGVVGFPLLFETQPRPLPMDTPFEVSRSAASVPAPPEPAPHRAATLVRPGPRVLADAGAEGVAELPALAPSAGAASAALIASAPALPAQPPGALVVPATASAPPAAAAARRAEAGSPATGNPPVPARAASAAVAVVVASAPSGAERRFVVQVGAYADAAATRDARASVEKLGFRSYTQDIEVAGTRRTRVRLGPFATRDEAETAAARVKRAGMQAFILGL
jgi:DedD protein